MHMYRKDGKNILIPIDKIPYRETWLYKNKAALASVKRGLEDAVQERITKLDLSKLFLTNKKFF